MFFVSLMCTRVTRQKKCADRHAKKLLSLKNTSSNPRNNNTRIHIHTSSLINWILEWATNMSWRLNSQMAVREMLVTAWLHACVCIQHLHGTAGYMCLSSPEALWYPNQPNSQLVNQRHLKRKHRRECWERQNSREKKFEKESAKGAREKEEGGSTFRKLADGNFFFLHVLRLFMCWPAYNMLHVGLGDKTGSWSNLCRQRW